MHSLFSLQNEASPHWRSISGLPCLPVTLATLLNPSFAFLEYLIHIAMIYEAIFQEYEMACKERSKRVH
jgi:hypothetical protein